MRRTTRGGLVMATAGLLALGVWSSVPVAQTPPGDGTVETTAQPEQTAAPETTAASEPTTTRRQREEDIPGTDETVPPTTAPPETAPPVTETTPAPPVRRGGPAGRSDAAGRGEPRHADPGRRAGPGRRRRRPRRRPTCPVTGPGGVAILAGLSLVLAGRRAAAAPGPPAGRRDPDLPAALTPRLPLRPVADRRGPSARRPVASGVGSTDRTRRRRVRTAARSVDREEPPCRRPSSSEPSGATRARASSPTSSPRRWRWSSATRAATTPGTPSSSTASASPSSWCPSGVLYDHITPVIGNGVVVDPAVLLAEIDMLERRGRRLQPAQGERQRPPDPARTTRSSTA